MSELQQNRYDQLVRRVGGIIGPGSKVSEVISELFPMIDVENVPPELLVYTGWHAAQRATQRTAGVGDLTASQLFNPLGSGLLVVLTKVLLSVNLVSDVNWQLGVAALADLQGRGQLRDDRAGGVVSGSATTETRTAAPFTVNPGNRARAEAGVTLELSDVNGLAILTPGIGWNVGTTVTNARLTVQYFWRERVAEQSELQF